MGRGGDGPEELLSALADPSRRRVLDLVLAHGAATSTMLAGELPFTRQAVAKHLAALERAGLVEARRQGREVRFAVRPDRLDAATQAMTELATRWDSRLRAIKRIAEAAHREGGQRAAHREGGQRAAHREGGQRAAHREGGQRAPDS